jgi:apolipoprotein N-acyltransferase
MAVFRSVETRRTTVRGTNSGKTCVITPEGRFVDPMQPFKMGCMHMMCRSIPPRAMT